MAEYDSLDFDLRDDVDGVKAKRRRRFTYGAIGLSTLVGLVLLGFALVNMLITLEAISTSSLSAHDFAAGISSKNLMKHLRALQDVADANGGSRSVRTGYNDSLAYIEEQLEKNTNYKIMVQEFQVAFTEQEQDPSLHMVTPNAVDYTYEVDFVGAKYQASGDVEAPLIWVEDACDDEDWGGFPSNTSIAFATIDGKCLYLEKVQEAEKHGALGIVLMNRGGSALSNNVARSINLKTPVTIPVFSITYPLAVQWNETMQGGDVTIRMTSNTSFTYATTSNICADTKAGRSDRVVLIGSHLDSVDAGPGINDNGSGSSSNLEIALEMYKREIKPHNKVRFCWFGAEEMGKKGSEFYVNSLSDAGRKNISAMLNMDMVASPNFFRGVYDGKSVDGTINKECAKIEEVFQDWFDQHDLPHEPTEFDSRSDYYAFLLNDIPAGGLFSGAEVKKSEESRSLYGGLANSAYDACYHASCDTYDNINQQSLLEMAQACAYVGYKLAEKSDLSSYLGA
eukprot:TRINITY_DN6473_c0_g1_i1.p1 TRINITY_DN6473_c0_g1~~TRINITY_DN6473_c0_g1_i1.p1  ORF type:complete len:510 (+),score=100.60 TRINITY_DN6473_c0_g1_i1:244-1773(+)